MTLSNLIDHFTEQRPGSYFLTHAPGQEQCSLYCAVPSGTNVENDILENRVNHGHNEGLDFIPLPLIPQAFEEHEVKRVFDLYEAHKSSGELDLSKEWFLPPAESYYEQQIPFLFPANDKADARWRAAKSID